MNGNPRMQRDGCVEDKRPEFVLSRPPLPKRPPTVHLDDPTYSAAHMAEGQEAMWLEEEASCTSTAIAAALSKPTPASLRVKPPKKTLFNFLPKKTTQLQTDASAVKGASRSQQPKKQRFRKIQKSVVLLPQSDGNINPLVGANAAQEAAVNMNKARSLLNQALTVERGTTQLEDSEKMAKFAFVHAAVARRIMATVDEEATLDGYLENMSQKGEQAMSNHQRIVFSMSFPDTPKSKQPWTFSNVVDGYAAQAKQYLESILPKNVDPSFTDAMSEDVWSQGEISSLGFSATYQFNTPKLVHYVSPPPKTSHFSDVLSMSSLNEILDGEMEEEEDDDDEATESQSGDDSESTVPNPKSVVPVNIQLKEKNSFGIFSFGLLDSAGHTNSNDEGEAEKEDPEMESRDEEDSVGEQSDSSDLECPTDGQDIETIAVEKFSGKKNRLMFGVIRKAKGGGDDSKVQNGNENRSAPAKTKGSGPISAQGRQVQKQKPQHGGRMPPKRQGGSHPTKQATHNKARHVQKPPQAMPKKRNPGAIQILPSMPSRSIDSEAEEGDRNDKYRTFEEGDSFNDETRKRLESKMPIAGEAESPRARIPRTAEVDARCIASVEEEESQESIDDQDEEPAEDKIITKRVRSLPKRLAGIFGRRRGNKTDGSTSVQSTPSTDIQNAMSEPSTDIRNAMSEEKVIEKAISDGNMMALEANLNAEVAPRIPAQKPRLPPRSTRSVHSDVHLSVIHVETVEVLPPLHESPFSPSIQAEETFPVPQISYKEKDEPVQRKSSKAKHEPVRQVKKQKKESDGRMVAKEKEEPVRREASKDRDAPVRREVTEEKERRREVSNEKDRASKEKKKPDRESSKKKEAPTRRGASKEKEETSKQNNRHSTREEKIRRVPDKEEDETERRVASKEKGEADDRRTIKDKEVPATKEEDEQARRVARKEMDANVRRIMGEDIAVRTKEEEKDYNIRRSVSDGKNTQAQRMTNREKSMQVRAVASQDAPGREAPGRSLKVSTSISAKNDPPLKKGVSQDRNLAPTPRRVDDSNSKFDQRALLQSALYGKKECDMSSYTTTIDGLLSQSESKETYAPELTGITASYSSSDSGDGSETATKASTTILSTIKQLWVGADDV